MARNKYTRHFVLSGVALPSCLAGIVSTQFAVSYT
jgi:hypothetical protein